VNHDLPAIQAALRGDAAVLQGNPMAAALRTRVVSAQPDQVLLEFEPPESFTQGTGVLQGGAVTAMLDFAMAFATLTGVPPGGSCASVTLNVAFLRPSPAGRYQAEGRLERRGRSMAFAQARLTALDTQTLVATATSALAITGSK
jgi:uncharacterized protein (TIGR00369 family)